MKEGMMLRRIASLVFGGAVFLSSCLVGADVSNSKLAKISLPEGFEIGVFAAEVPNARSMCRSPKGIIYVGTRTKGVIYAIRDMDNDYRADKVTVIARGLNMPNGVAFADGNLYVAEVHRVLRFDNIDRQLQKPPAPVVVNDSFPADRHHGWKYIGFGPDGLLYIPVGAPCNVCDKEKENPKYASIMRMKKDGTELELFARGVRNTVGFDWHPTTKELWFTDNGRDWLGDNQPPDELNHAPRKGLHFGFPFCHGKGIKDPKFGKPGNCTSYTPPAIELGPHVAALGMHFYTGAMFPQKYFRQIFIAEHGSWNRTQPIGYRITNVFLKGGKAVKYETFASGWLNGKWGRPVDILQLPDGSLLISDDKAGVIYRITYQMKK